MGPDYRVLVTEARKAASIYATRYGEPIPTEQLVIKMATVMQVIIPEKLINENQSNLRCL